jgi:hypothetical protein
MIPSFHTIMNNSLILSNSLTTSPGWPLRNKWKTYWIEPKKIDVIQAGEPGKVWFFADQRETGRA